MRQSRPALYAGLLPLLLAACAISPAASGARAVADGSSFPLAAGETVTLPDRGRLRYDRIVNDSRCPPDVQCVWAGDAEVAFTWTPAGGKAETFSLHTGRGDKSRTLGTRSVTLESLERGANAAAQLKLDRAP